MGEQPTRLRQCFLQEGEYWTIEFGGSVCRLRDSKGMRYLALLLSHPGGRYAAGVLSRAVDHGDLDPLIAAEPATGTRRDPFGGLREADENARVRVTRVIHAALRRLEYYHPQAGAHLRATIRTGRVCTYAPDPRLSSTWICSVAVAARRDGPGQDRDP